MIGIKGREITCLGDVVLDLVALKNKIEGNGININNNGTITITHQKAKLDKSKDAKAYLLFDIKFVESSQCK